MFESPGKHHDTVGQILLLPPLHLAPRVVSRSRETTPFRRRNSMPLCIVWNRPGLGGRRETTNMVVPAPTTLPAKADGRQCGPLVINPRLFMTFRVNNLRQMKPNPANILAARVAGQTLTTLLTLVTNPDAQVPTLMTTNNWSRGCSIIIHSHRQPSSARNDAHPHGAANSC